MWNQSGGAFSGRGVKRGIRSLMGLEEKVAQCLDVPKPSTSLVSLGQYYAPMIN